MTEAGLKQTKPAVCGVDVPQGCRMNAHSGLTLKYSQTTRLLSGCSLLKVGFLVQF